jgi:hypothetical protein
VDKFQIPAYIATKPLGRIRRLAAALGWRGIRISCGYACGIGQVPTPATPIHVTYMTPDLKFNLQINENPLGQSRRYSATVKAERYGIVNAGWVHFELPDDDESLARLAESLPSLLRRNNYKDRKWVRELKKTPDRVQLPRMKKKQRGKRA